MLTTFIFSWVDSANWHDWGVDALALDPTNSNTLYIAVGMYTNSCVLAGTLFTTT